MPVTYASFYFIINVEDLSQEILSPCWKKWGKRKDDQPYSRATDLEFVGRTYSSTSGIHIVLSRDSI